MSPRQHARQQILQLWASHSAIAVPKRAMRGSPRKCLSDSLVVVRALACAQRVYKRLRRVPMPALGPSSNMSSAEALASAGLPSTAQFRVSKKPTGTGGMACKPAHGVGDGVAKESTGMSLHVSMAWCMCNKRACFSSWPTGASRPWPAGTVLARSCSASRPRARHTAHTGIRGREN